MESALNQNLSVPIPNTKIKDWKIVHTIVSGQGSLVGRKFVHAFLLYRNSIVCDQSNGNNVTLPKELYYKLGKIDMKKKGAYAEYTVEEARKKMASSGHHGPWDIDESLEENFDQISIKRQKIDSKMMAALKK